MLNLSLEHYLRIFYDPKDHITDWWLNISKPKQHNDLYFTAQYLGKYEYYNSENIILAIPIGIYSWGNLELQDKINNVLIKLQTHRILCWNRHIINGLNSGRIELC